MSTYTCPPDHAHAEKLTCYSTHGCRCDSCRAGGSAYNRERYRAKHGAPLIPSGPTSAALRALVVQGWSIQNIAERTGCDRTVIAYLRDGRRPMVRQATARRISNFCAKVAPELAFMPTRM